MFHPTAHFHESPYALAMRLAIVVMLLACSSTDDEEPEVAPAPTPLELREVRRVPTRAKALIGRGDELLVGGEGELVRMIDGEIVETLERPAYRGGALVENGPLIAWPTWSRGDEVRELGEPGTRLLDSVADAREVFELRERDDTRLLHAYDANDPAEPRELARGPRLSSPMALSDAWIALVAGSVRVLERDGGREVALLSTGDRYAVRALAFDGDELVGIDAQGTLIRWRLDRPERESEPTPVADPRSLTVEGDTTLVVGMREVWVRRRAGSGDRIGRHALEAGQIESSLLLGDTLVLGVRGRPSHVLWLRIE